MVLAATAELRHISEDRPVAVDKIELALRDYKHLTYEGIAGQ